MDELIQTSDAQGLRGAGIVAAIFLMIVTATGAAELLMPTKKLKLVDQERRDAAQLEKERSFWDGSLAASYETNFRLHGYVRRWVAPFWSAAMLGLGDVPSDDLLVGQEGWLFLRNRVYLPKRAWPEAHQHLANLFGLVKRSLASHGTELVCVPLPRKSSVCYDKLPVGIDSRGGFERDFDAAVVAAIQARGVTTVDIGPVWAEHPSEDLYLKYDSHWAPPARRMLADEIKRRVPALPKGNASYSYVTGAERVASDGLRFAGVDRGHPANALFDAPDDAALILRPKGSEGRLDSRELESDVLLVGTSFCKLFQFRALLCDALQASVEDASEPGRMPLLSLEKALITRPLEEVPPFVIVEFPVHHAGLVHRGLTPTVRAALGIARQFDFAGRAQVIPGELFKQTLPETPKLHAPIFSYPPGSLLSSGDGIFGIRIEFDGDEDSKWTFSTSGAEIAIGANKGARVRAFPIVEGGSATSYYASLLPTLDASLGTQVRASVVTDADLVNGIKFTGERTADGSWIAAPEQAIAPKDSLALSWDEFTSGPVEIIATGTDTKGEDVEHTWRFPTAQQVRFAILTLGPFEGGFLHRVVLRGASDVVTGAIAHQARSL